MGWIPLRLEEAFLDHKDLDLEYSWIKSGRRNLNSWDPDHSGLNVVGAGINIRREYQRWQGQGQSSRPPRSKSAGSFGQ